MSTPRLHFLADESCDFAVVRALRAVGYDCLDSLPHQAKQMLPSLV
jgi:hypothetical protein